MIQIAIVEDEEIYVKQLTEYIRKYHYQRADGRYRFRYVDIHGNEGNLYSWRLDHNQSKI